MLAKSGYTGDAVEAARIVLLELTRLLGQYRDDIVLIGGWVPELLCPEAESPHTGSIDVDLALNHRTLQDAGYRTIQQLLLAHGYQEGSQPFVFHRVVKVNGRDITVEVDFLAGESEGTGPGHRTQKVQGIRARKARGCDLAFEMSTEVTIQGTLPGGAKDSAMVRVATIVPFIVMKGMALHDRLKAKDAYDIYYCLCNYPGGLDSVVESFLPHLENPLVQEGLKKIAEKFVSPAHTGPKAVAAFEGIEDAEARAQLERDAYERVTFLLERLKIK